MSGRGEERGRIQEAVGHWRGRAGRGSGWRAMVTRLSCIFSGGCEELLF